MTIAYLFRFDGDCIHRSDRPVAIASLFDYAEKTVTNTLFGRLGKFNFAHPDGLKSLGFFLGFLLLLGPWGEAAAIVDSSSEGGDNLAGFEFFQCVENVVRNFQTV